MFAGHPVRGGVFLLAEGITGSMAYYENERNTERFHMAWKNLEDSLAEIQIKRDQVRADTLENDTAYIQQVENRATTLWFREGLRQGDFRNSLQLRNMSLIWTGGIYLYNLCDALELGIRSHREPGGKKNPTVAVWCSLLLPGLGQVYNGSFGKAGMIVMAQSAFVASAAYRWQLMNYYQERLDVAKADSAIMAVSDYDYYVQELTNRRNASRRGRNSFIWYSLGFYFYNVFDALVDAHLHDFNDRLEIGLHPDFPGPGLSLRTTFKFG